MRNIITRMIVPRQRAPRKLSRMRKADEDMGCGGGVADMMSTWAFDLRGLLNCGLQMVRKMC
jgi:hypothetical protein